MQRSATDLLITMISTRAGGLTVHTLLCVFVLAMVGFGASGFGSVQEERKVAPGTLHRALDDFKKALDERWSYRHANAADFDAAIAALRLKGADGLSIDEFGLELHKIVAMGIDAHSGVVGYQLPGTGYLPFLIEPDGERFVAFKEDRTAFLADGFPYLLQIDGRHVEEWCKAAAVIVPKGSPQFLRQRCLGGLRNLDFVRGLMKVPARDTVDVALASSSGGARRTLTLRVSKALPEYGKWPRGGSRALENRIGYLRLTNMVAETSLQEIRLWMPRFRDTAGLVIDVRDNAGGDRDALMLLYSYLAAPGDPPRVFNAAAYRLHNAHPHDHLSANHRMYRMNAAHWSEAQRAAVAAFARTFKPVWQLPDGHFSEWHYMALTRLDDKDVYHYDRPTAVLMNGKSFSSTDNFLAGLKGMKNVTLVGTASAGGSAYTREIPLGETPLRLRIGSIASFQSDGRLFDGHGVQPDVLVEPLPEYHIGGPDNVLIEALKRIVAK
jgi:hypothetical protein